MRGSIATTALLPVCSSAPLTTPARYACLLGCDTSWCPCYRWQVHHMRFFIGILDSTQGFCVPQVRFSSVCFKRVFQVVSSKWFLCPVVLLFFPSCSSVFFIYVFFKWFLCPVVLLFFSSSSSVFFKRVFPSVFQYVVGMCFGVHPSTQGTYDRNDVGRSMGGIQVHAD